MSNGPTGSGVSGPGPAGPGPTGSGPTGSGPALRTDKVQVFIIDRHVGGADGTIPHLLQLRRADHPMRGTWQPVMGTIEPGESAPRAAVRELREETGLCAEETTVELFQLDGVHPFYMASREAIYLCPCFFVAVAAGWSPVLNAEHDDWRWVPLAQAASVTVWPGQRASVTELIEVLGGPPEALDPLRIDLDSLG